MANEKFSQFTSYTVSASGDIIVGLSSGGNAKFPIGTTPAISTAAAWDASRNLSALGFLLNGSSSGVISILPQAAAGTFNFNLPITAGTSGYFLTSGGGGSAPMTWTSVSASGAITTINGNSGSVTPTAGAVTINGGSTGLTTSGSASTLSLTGTLAILNGGTGVTSVTTSPTASAWAGWDSNKNLSSNNLIEGYTTTVTAAGTTSLLVGSTRLQYFTGSTTQTVTMPVTSTLVLGQQYMITNLSSGAVTVQSSGANTIQIMAPNSTLFLTCILTSGTGTASWNWQYGNSGTLTPGYTTTVTAAGTTTLTVSSTYLQFFTGTTTQTVTLPVASTLTLGQQYRIVNNSTGVVTVQSSGANTLVAMATLTEMIVTCILTSGTGTASWSWEYMAWQNVNGNTIGSDISINSLTAGRGAGNSLTNLCFGSGALASSNTLTFSVAIGQNVLASATGAGVGNLVIGALSADACTNPGNFNTGFGYRTFRSATFTGGGNSAVGNQALQNVTSGANNMGIGNNAGATLTTGSNNVFIGYFTGTSTAILSGSNNIFLGTNANGNSSSCSGAIAIGTSVTTTASTGSGSGNNGPGIAIGSSGFHVGFRGDGTIYTGGTGRGYWRPLINGTAYLMPCFIDGTLTASAGMVTDVNGSPILTAAMTNGQVIIGSTGATPTAATLTQGTGISISTGPGSITISSTGVGSLTWNDVAGTTQPAAVNSGYIISNAGQTTVTLPATAAAGSVFAVAGKGASGWILQANTGQIIHFGSSATSSAGSLTSTNQWDSVTIVCVTANTTFSVISSQGILTVA